jgi:protein-L-isoaspartate(D-aspartate) O-methyltransferase
MNVLVDSLVQSGVITCERVSQVMRKVDRQEFCPSRKAYEDCPQSINFGATISAPHMHAYCLVLFLFKTFLNRNG